MTQPCVLVLGGGDVGSAVARSLFALGARVLISERPTSAHARRGMAYIDALFDGTASLEGVEARVVADIAAVQACWTAARAIPIATLPEAELLAQLRFDVVVDAIMRRNQVPPDLRVRADVAVGVGPGYTPGENCHVAIETQWGPGMGAVLRDRAPADRVGGPWPLGGVGRERFVSAPIAGRWRTTAALGQTVAAGEALGHIGEVLLRAPMHGCLRGLAHDGVEVEAGQKIIEVDPREEPQVFGTGERPQAIARGVVAALGWGTAEPTGPAGA